MVIGIVLGVFFLLMYGARQESIEEYYQIRILVDVVFVFMDYY
jgi:hypothetical protein